MGAAIPCLGYPSRTAAILAMRADGVTTADIARRIGIEPKTVTALEASLWRGNLRSIRPMAPASASHQNLIRVDAESLAKLRPAASRRGISVAALIDQLFIVMTDDGLIDALLDDAPNGAA